MTIVRKTLNNYDNNIKIGFFNYIPIFDKFTLKVVN